MDKQIDITEVRFRYSFHLMILAVLFNIASIYVRNEIEPSNWPLVNVSLFCIALLCCNIRVSKMLDILYEGLLNIFHTQNLSSDSTFMKYKAAMITLEALVVFYSTSRTMSEEGLVHLAVSLGFFNCYIYVVGKLSKYYHDYLLKEFERLNISILKELLEEDDIE